MRPLPTFIAALSIFHQVNANHAQSTIRPVVGITKTYISHVTIPITSSEQLALQHGKDTATTNTVGIQKRHKEHNFFKNFHYEEKLTRLTNLDTDTDFAKTGAPASSLPVVQPPWRPLNLTSGIVPRIENIDWSWDVGVDPDPTPKEKRPPKGPRLEQLSTDERYLICMDIARCYERDDADGCILKTDCSDCSIQGLTDGHCGVPWPYRSKDCAMLHWPKREWEYYLQCLESKEKEIWLRTRCRSKLLAYPVNRPQNWLSSCW